MEQHAEKTFYDIEGHPIRTPTKINLLRAAVELFAQRGYSAASVRDITKRVGIKESSLYKHFQSKDEMLETIFVNFRRDVEAILPPLESIERIVEAMSLREFLERGWANYKAHIHGDPLHLHVWSIVYSELFRHPMAKDIYMNGIVARTIDRLALVFAGMAKRGKIAALDPRLLASEYQYPLFAVIMEYSVRLSDGESVDDLERQVADFVKED